MVPAAGGLPSVVLVLTLAFVALGLVLLVVLAPSGRARAARGVVVVGLLAMGLAVFTLSQRSALRRTPAWAPAPPGAPISVVVPEPPAPPVDASVADDTEEPDEDSVTITGEFPDIPEFAKGWLNATGAPVRFEGSKLVIGGHSVPPVETRPSSQSSGMTERQKRALEVEVRTKVRRDAAESLAEYFEGLVDEPPPAVPRLSELRATLKQLTADQRARIAEQAARLPTVVPRRQTTATGKSETGRVEFFAPEVEITPEQIRGLIKTELARAHRTYEVSTPAKVLGTIGVLIGAVAVLKIATRRHSGVNPGR